MAYYCFLAVLIFSPLAFGTVEAWSYAVMESMIGLCALLLLFPRRQTPLYRPPGLVPLFLIAAYLLLQVIPLPPALVRLFSPEAFRIYHQTAGAFEPSGWMSLSIHPRATVFELARFLSYLVFYIVAVQLLADRVLMKRTMAVLAVFAGLLAFMAIIQFIDRQLSCPAVGEKIFWIRNSVHGRGSIGPYVNRNHYAGLMEMIFPLMFSLFLVYRPGSSASTWKLRLRDFLTHHRINHYFLYGLAALLIGTSVFVSLSRGGIISLTLSMFLLSLWLTRRAKKRKVSVMAALLFLGILVLTGSDAWDRIFERFGEIRNEAGEIQTGRFHYWRDGRTIIGHFPLTGSGVGTWQDIYPRFRTFPGSSRLEHAHNDYIEFLSTGGIILTGLMGLALFRVIQVSYRSFKRRRERLAIYLFAACLAAVASILLHSVVDFNLQVGANGLYFFFVLAVMVSAANTRFLKGYGATYLPRAAVDYRWPRATALVFLSAMIVIHGGVMLANYHFFDFRDMALTEDISDKDLCLRRQAAERAAFFDPLNAGYHQAAAETAAILDEPEKAGHHYQRAVRLFPLDIQVLQDAGRFLSRQGEMDAAAILLSSAIAYSRNHISSYLNYAAALLENNRVTEGLDVLSAAMKDNPDNTDACLALMTWWGLPDSQMKETLPDRASSYLAFGDYLASLGRYEAAEAAYWNALTLVNREETIQKEVFIHVYKFFKNRREPEKALAVIKQALVYFPDDAGLKRLQQKISS